MATLPPGDVLSLASLIAPTPHGVASRVLARSAAGNVTLFVFDTDEELSEHTAPFDALLLTLDGSLTLTIGGRTAYTTPHSIVLLPANVAHAIHADAPTQMLLIMLREPPRA